MAKKIVDCELSGLVCAGKSHLIKLFTAAAVADGWVCLNVSDPAVTDSKIAEVKRNNEKVLLFNEVIYE